MFTRFIVFLFFVLHTSFAFSNMKPNLYENKISKNILDKFFPTYKLVGKANYRFFLLNIYDAELISKSGNYPSDTFALILKYNSNFSKKSVIKVTIEQLQLQKNYSNEELEKLENLLNNTFRPIKKNDQFIGIKLENKGYFFFENKKVLETYDMEFLNLFFNIWLKDNGENPAFTKSLIGKNK